MTRDTKARIERHPEALYEAKRGGRGDLTVAVSDLESVLYAIEDIQESWAQEVRAMQGGD